jgi:tetratricopeptide (TPR) repeat protein
MEYQDYLNRTNQAAKLMQSGRFKEAVVCLYKLFLSDISDIDKVNICTNMATVYDRMGNTEEAISWYDKGIAIEQNYHRFEAHEQKAQYLSQIGHNQEAVPIYESLISQPFISEADKERMRKATQTLLSQAMKQWK